MPPASAGMAGLTPMRSDHQIALPGVAADGWSRFYHDHSDILIERPAKIVAVIVVAFALRWLLHRSVDRLTRPVRTGDVPRILNPLKERVASTSRLRFERRTQRAEALSSVLKSVISVTILAIAFLTILPELGINLAPFIAGTSIVGVALGFGAQNIVKDFLAGIFMIFEDQYGVGDVIDFEKASGTVEAVGLRTTRLRDVYGTVWYVRNGEVVRVGNKSQGFAQVVLDVPVASSVEIDRASSIMQATASAMFVEDEWAELFLAEPEVQGVEELTRLETTIRLVARVRPLQQWRVGRELRRRIQEQFLDEGITAVITGAEDETAPEDG
jgi:small conductance mechanosensitive channel